MQIPLDQNLLQPNRRDKNRWQCPACAEAGSDKSRDHLKIFPDGKWGCCLDQSKEHARRIIELAGVKTDYQPDPAEIARRRAEDERQRAAAEAVAHRRRETARHALHAIVRKYEWNEADLWESSPIIIETPTDTDGRFFISRMFAPSDIVWSGQRKDSDATSDRAAAHWQTAASWQSSPLAPGPLLHPGTWPPGTGTRSAKILTSPWLVADFDENPFTGKKPETDSELAELRKIALAVTKWLVEAAGWTLGAILETGGHGVHSWLARPQKLASVQTELAAIGLDANLFRTSQTARLPGHPHQRTGKMSRVLWLK